VDVSVLIPTYQRSAKLAACVASLARQTGEHSFEVVVGLDGPDPGSRQAAGRAWKEAGGDKPGRSLRIIDCDRQGYIAVRNRLVSEACGRVMLSLNDDVEAETGLVAAHLREHDRRRAEKLGPAVVVGDAPYKKRPPTELDSMLDRLVRETSMVFFYDVMNAPPQPGAQTDREKDWGFRHCFGLNFSAEIGCVREVGGVGGQLSKAHLYGYDDIELAFKLARRFRSPVLYRPEAKVWHNHFYTAKQLMDRERQLGHSAWYFAEASPAFGRAVFGRDIRSKEELAYSREFVQREKAAAEGMLQTLACLERIPSMCISGEHGPKLTRALYEQHLLLKRWMWRTGLLEAAGDVA